MKKLAFLLLAVLFIAGVATAQNDTIYHYYTKDAREVSKDSSFVYMTTYKHDNGWHGVEFYTKGNIMRSEGNYLDKDAKTPTGSFRNYNENGKLDNTAEYDNGKPLSKTYYFKNGAKKSWIAYNDKGVNQQKGWDETGKEVKNFVVERGAIFKGGADGWSKYLGKNLDANVASNAGAPAGKYEVTVQFVVSKEGYVSNVKAVSVPEACKPCAKEAISKILSAPQWEPAIQNNEPVIFRVMQNVVFEVEERKGGKKN